MTGPVTATFRRPTLNNCNPLETDVRRWINNRSRIDDFCLLFQGNQPLCLRAFFYDWLTEADHCSQPLNPEYKIDCAYFVLKNIIFCTIRHHDPPTRRLRYGKMARRRDVSTNRGDMCISRYGPCPILEGKRNTPYKIINCRKIKSSKVKDIVRYPW